MAREVQDPFGFDENDLNIYGYENNLIEDVDVIVNGPLRVRLASARGTPAKAPGIGPHTPG